MNEWGFAAEISKWWEQAADTNPLWRVNRVRVEKWGATMPFDEGFLAGESQTSAYLADSLTEALVAMMFGIKPETLKKWRTDGIGPPRTTEGNIVLFPIPLLRSYLTERARGAHVSQRPPRG